MVSSTFEPPSVAQFISLLPSRPPQPPTPSFRKTWFMTFEKFLMLLNVCYSVLILLKPPSFPHLGALSPHRKIVKLLTNA